jgi:hypothetical protein
LLGFSRGNFTKKKNKKRSARTMRKLMQIAGLISLALMTSSLSGCADVPKPVNAPDYTPEQVEKIIEDGRTCGPAAQDALFDLCTMIGC